MTEYSCSYDKYGNQILVGSLVWFNVFEPKLRHNGVRNMLGRIVEISQPSISANWNMKISLGCGLKERMRKCHEVRLATESDAEKLFEQQFSEYQNELMLFILENAS